TAAVRAGRRPPRPNSAPTIRATPASIPGSSPRMPAAAPPTGTRPRANTGSHRPPPPRRTFSSGQRALLWAAGVLGALAIISAILIVLADRDRKDNKPVEQTVTDTVTPTSQAAPSGWTDHHIAGNPGGQIGVPRFSAASMDVVGSLSEAVHTDEKPR
ncbi:serine/threonine protein kinase, partial [Mycolicibacterium rhodesiae]|nr:serine/threonine protein kinase [Mycolicibacterium rhodesiae]